MACLGLLLPSCVGIVKVVSNEVEAQKPIQLTEGTFDSELRRVPASYGIMVEFYAHWYVLGALSCGLCTRLTYKVSCAAQVPHLPGVSASV